MLPQLLYYQLFITYAYYALKKQSTLLSQPEWDAALVVHKMTGIVIILLGLYVQNRIRKRFIYIFNIADGAIFFSIIVMTSLILINPSWLFDIGPRFWCAILSVFTMYPVQKHLMLFSYMARQTTIIVEVLIKTVPYLIISVVIILCIACSAVFLNLDRKAS